MADFFRKNKKNILSYREKNQLGGMLQGDHRADQQVTVEEDEGFFRAVRSKKKGKTFGGYKKKP